MFLELPPHRSLPPAAAPDLLRPNFTVPSRGVRVGRRCRRAPGGWVAMVTELHPEGGGPAKANAKTDEAPKADNLRRFSILIADDDRGNREALGEMLSARGFKIMLAADGG